MKFVVISDTHGQHRNTVLPHADTIIHAGDVSRKGEINEIVDFLDWFKKLDYKYKIFIAGNHDFYFEKTPEKEIGKIIPKGIHYLNDSGLEIENIKIWGSPVTPWFYNWAFNRRRGKLIAKHWDLIPKNTDILITHGSPANHLDKTNDGLSAGCVDLLEKVMEVNPKFHLFGHVHEAYGQISTSETQFINASVLDANYRQINSPICFEL